MNQNKQEDTDTQKAIPPEQLGFGLCSESVNWYQKAPGKESRVYVPLALLTKMDKSTYMGERDSATSYWGRNVRAGEKVDAFIYIEEAEGQGVAAAWKTKAARHKSMISAWIQCADKVEGAPDPYIRLVIDPQELIDLLDTHFCRIELSVFEGEKEGHKHVLKI